MSSNPYMAKARTRKARKIAIAIRDAGRGMSAEELARAAVRMHPEDRLTVASAVGVNPPSDSTWRKVVWYLRHSTN